MNRLLAAAAWAAPVLTLTSGALLAQERLPAGDALPAPASIASDPPGLRAPPPERPPEAFAATELGPVRIVPIDERDDAVPLPVPARWRAAEGGDVLETPASGDPHFLSFAAGAHRPPSGERIDPRLVAEVQAHYADGRPRQETYAFAMFERLITPERVAELEQLGARVLGFHPHHSLKLALPPHAIDLVAAHPAVRWVGLAQPWQKLHPRLADAPRSGDGRIAVYVNLFESDLSGAQTSAPAGSVSEGVGARVEVAPEDSAQLPRITLSNGWQQRALEDLAVEVREYDDSIHAFRARIFPQSLQQLVALDFVQFIEPDVESRLHHDESMAMINADRQRVFFDGGTTATIVGAEVDSGIDIAHLGLDSFAWIAWDLAGGGATNDGCGHGSHVNGTWMGDGTVKASYEGVAERLGWGATGRFKIIKKFTNTCGDGGASMATILNVTRNGYTDGGGNFTRRPHVINHSWGSTLTGGWLGSEADARALDADIYTYRQLHVFSAGNDGPSADSLTQHASAKNVLTVGNVTIHETSVGDPGTIWTGSSRGPTGDLRWKPNLSAPGTSIYSANAGTSTGYTNSTGTSMAAPHVSGVATQVMDRFSFLRDNAATLKALMMASALTPNNVLQTSEGDVHLDSYGTGRVEAFRASGGNGQTAVYFWAYEQGASGYGQFDINVGAGATRLTVCMVYHEPAASSGAGQALVNNLNLYLDAAPFSAGGNTGEYTTQQSIRDNSEIRSLNNPAAGGWRFKVYPQSVVSTSHVGLCAIVDYGDTTPSGSLLLSSSKTYVKPNENVSITATATNPAFVASGVFLDSTSSGDSLQSSNVTLKDGAVASLTHNPTGGRDVLLGNIAFGENRTATWVTRWASEGSKAWTVNARSDNWVDRLSAVTVVVDGTSPGLVTNLSSSTHQPNVWSSATNVQFGWTAALDNLSGIDGYSILVSNNASALPDMIKDINAVTSNSQVMTTSTLGRFFNIRAVDRSGNWGGSTSVGPYLIDAVQPGPAGPPASTTHQVNGSSCSTAISMNWSPASDAHSGIAGYRYLWDHAPGTSANGGTNIGNVNSGSFNLTTPSSQGWYFHLAARDQAGNVGPTVHAGPYFIVADPATVYCTAKVNSQGCTPQIAFQNAPSLSGGAFQVSASQLINNQLGVLFWSTNGPSSAPFQGGTLCVAPPVLRSPLMNSGGNVGPPDCSGSMSFNWTGSYLLSNGLGAGQTVHCQFWTRDPGSPSGTGLSNAVRFTICD